MEIAYEPGVATFVKQRGALASTYEIFAPPDFPGDMRLLTLTNKGTQTLRLRIAPFFDMALDEGPNESAGHLEAWSRDGVLLFDNRRNDLVRGVAFVTTTLQQSEDRNGAPPLLRSARPRHHLPGDGRCRRGRPRPQRRRPQGRRLRLGHRT